MCAFEFTSVRVCARVVLEISASYGTPTGTDSCMEQDVEPHVHIQLTHEPFLPLAPAAAGSGPATCN